MPRIARLFIENASNHIVARGIGKKQVFVTEDDYRCYINLIHKYKIKNRCLLYAYWEPIPNP